MEESRAADRQASGDRIPDSGSSGKYDEKKDVEANKLVASLSYLGLLVIVPILVAKDSKFIRFHARQGLVLFALDLIASFFVWIPLIGWFFGIGLLAVSVYGFVQAIQGRFWRLPYLAHYAEKINI